MFEIAEKEIIEKKVSMILTLSRIQIPLLRDCWESSLMFSSRSVPSVKESEYLQTIGKQLDKSIQVFWTGSMVVSEVITAKECKALAEVIKRKPIIWDNIHANDYDHQRLFLGPYVGRDRSVPPSSYLSGAMTNPNCEYSLNIPALVTLAEWANNEDWDKTGKRKG